MCPHRLTDHTTCDRCRKGPRLHAACADEAKSRVMFFSLLPGFLFFLCSLTRCLAPALLKLRPYGAVQIWLLLLLLPTLLGVVVAAAKSPSTFRPRDRQFPPIIVVAWAAALSPRAWSRDAGRSIVRRLSTVTYT